MADMPTGFSFRGFRPSPWVMGRLMARLSREELRGPGSLREIMRLSRERGPDLEAHLRERWPEENPVLGDLGRLGDALVGRSHVATDLCEVAEDGTVIVAASSIGMPRRVRRGDDLLGGVLFTGRPDDGECRISPRIVRVVCGNGAVVPTREVHEEHEYVREAGAEPVTDPAVAVAAGLSGRVVDASLGGLRAAAQIRVSDPVEALREHMIRVPRRHEVSVRRVFRNEGDRTLFGAFNALTQTARDVPDPRERVALERLAGRLVTADLREDAAVLV